MDKGGKSLLERRRLRFAGRGTLLHQSISRPKKDFFPSLERRGKKKLFKKKASYPSLHFTYRAREDPFRLVYLMGEATSEGGRSIKVSPTRC